MIKILSKNITVNTPNIMCELYYDITARTKTSVTIKFTVKSWLSSGSTLGQGSTYGINGYVKINGTSYKIAIKATNYTWKSGNTYTATATYTISGIKGYAVKLTGVQYGQTRTGDKDDGKFEHAGEFNYTACSNIAFDSYPVFLKTKVRSRYKDGTLYRKQNGEWTKNGLGLFVKKDGTWIEV